MHDIIEGPHYEHALEGAAANDQQRRSRQAYGEASADRGGAPSPRRTRLKPVAKIFPVFLPFLGTFRWMCRFGGGECREEFRTRVETGGKRADKRCATEAPVRGEECIVSGRACVPHCNAPPSLFYKRREGSLVKGLPILNLQGIPILSRVTLVKSCSRVSNFFSYCLYSSERI